MPPCKKAPAISSMLRNFLEKAKKTFHKYHKNAANLNAKHTEKNSVVYLTHSINA
jgi:hypothetical protein